MSRKAKYIIWDDGLKYGVSTFSIYLNHSDVASRLGVSPISAGFVEFESDYTSTVTISGESVSLKLSSRPEDAKIIAREFQIMNFKINR